MSYRPAESLESRRLFAVALPTDYEQYMLELLNRARANPTAEANRLGVDLNEGLSPGTISSAPKQPLAFNTNLIDAARTHSAWMIANDVFAHSGQGGTDPGDRMDAAGYAFTGSWGWGENLAYRSQKPGTPEPVSTTAQEHDDLFIDAGIDGRGHRINLMKDTFKEVGIGIATGDFNTYNALMSTQDFAFQSGNSFLTGVAYYDDLNDDDFYTPGEGLGGVTITARRHGDNAEFTTTTLDTGGYSLALPAGTYDVTATGGEIGSASGVWNDVAIGSFNVKRDFVGAGEQNSPTPTPSPAPTPAPPPLTGSVKGRVYNDLNANGKKDGKEPGLGGVVVYVDENLDGTYNFGDGELEASVVADGSFAAGGLEPGVHRVRVVVPDGWRVTLPGEGYFDVVVKAKKAAKVKPITLTSKAVVSGASFDDANANGQRDAGEAGLKKRRVFGDLDGDGLWNKLTEPATVSDKVGNWILPLDAGNYTVRSIAGKGYQSAEPGADGISLTVAGAGASTGHLFGERRLIAV